MVTTMNNVKNVLLLGFSLLVFITGCSSTSGVSSSMPNQTNVKTMLVNEYHIGVDDQIQISVWKNPDLSISVPVPRAGSSSTR